MEKSRPRRTSNSRPMPKYRPKEGKLQFRRISKLASSILEILENLNTISQRKSPLEFVAPMEIVKRNKHWQDYLCSARRLIFSLKIELAKLSNTVPDPESSELKEKIFRNMCSTSRTCYQLLKGLENFPNEIRIGKKGYQIMKEASDLACKLIVIMSLYGVIPSSDPEVFKGEAEESNRTLESEEESFINISTSDMDAEAFTLIDSQNVRLKLSNLAKNQFPNKKKKFKGTHHKVIQPLKTHPKVVMEELANGRKIQFFEDTLSSKLRKTSSAKSYQSENSGIIPRSRPHLSAEKPDGLSEKMAEAVFERILPYIRDNRRVLVDNSNRSADVDTWMTMKIKLKNIGERLEVVENAVRQRARFFEKIKKDHLKKEEVLGEYSDLTKAIARAEEALRNTTEMQYPYPYPTYSIDKIRKTFEETGQLDINPDGKKTRTEDFYSTLNEELDKNLKKKSERKAESFITTPFVSLQDEIQAQKREFWSSLVGSYIKPYEDPDPIGLHGDEEGSVDDRYRKQDVGITIENDNESVDGSKDENDGANKAKDNLTVRKKVETINIYERTEGTGASADNALKKYVGAQVDFDKKDVSAHLDDKEKELSGSEEKDSASVNHYEEKDVGASVNHYEKKDVGASVTHDKEVKVGASQDDIKPTEADSRTTDEGQTSDNYSSDEFEDSDSENG